MPYRPIPLVKLGLITLVFGGIQFSWALQLALLTPFVQTLGIPHSFASLMWLCGPISGLIMQPLIGVVRAPGCVVSLECGARGKAPLGSHAGGRRGWLCCVTADGGVRAWLRRCCSSAIGAARPWAAGAPSSSLV